jgi:uncharacterized double-CXXCG motif protein
MRFFELSIDDNYDAYIEAEHRWGLPGVNCRACGETWGTTGISYPTVELAGKLDAKDYESRWPVDWDEFVRLRARIQPLLPRDAMAPPGTTLGPLVGRAEGRMGDIVWQHAWTPLVKPAAFADLCASLAPLRGAASHLLGPPGTPPLIELELEPHGTLAEKSLPVHRPAPCELCGRVELTRPAQPVLARASLPASPTIFRLRDLPTAIIIAERGLERLAALRLTGFVATEVPVD